MGQKTELLETLCLALCSLHMGPSQTALRNSMMASLTPLHPTSSPPSSPTAPPQVVFQKTLQDRSPVTCERLVTESRDKCLGRGWENCVVKFLLGLPGCSPSLCHPGTHHGAPLPLSLSLSACPAVAYGSQFSASRGSTPTVCGSCGLFATQCCL